MNRFAAASTASNVRQENFNAVNVDLNGRYMLENRSEFPCIIKRMSPGTALMSGIATPRNGERIIAYIDHVGRIEGIANEVTSEGFHILLSTSEQKKDKLSAQLTWLANKHELALPEDRRHERVVPRKTQQNITFADGAQRLCRIADLSLPVRQSKASSSPRSRAASCLDRSGELSSVISRAVLQSSSPPSRPAQRWTIFSAESIRPKDERASRLRNGKPRNARNHEKAAKTAHFALNLSVR
jgi:hypothetical protein